jgi:hypothetical protein
LHASFHHLKLLEDWGAFSFELQIAACYQPSWYLNNLLHIYLLTIYFLENQHHVVSSGSNLAIRNIVIAFFSSLFFQGLWVRNLWELKLHAELHTHSRLWNILFLALAPN